MQDIGAKVAKVLHLLFEVHQLEGSQVLQVADRPAKPSLLDEYMG